MHRIKDRTFLIVTIASISIAVMPQDIRGLENSYNSSYGKCSITDRFLEFAGCPHKEAAVFQIWFGTMDEC